MLENIKAAVGPWVGWIATWSLPVRLLIAASLTAVGSAGSVGVITKIGAYWFVLWYGVRTPADGIPYVAETAAVLSVIILCCAAFAYACGFVFIEITIRTTDLMNVALGWLFGPTSVFRTSRLLLKRGPYDATLEGEDLRRERRRIGVWIGLLGLAFPLIYATGITWNGFPWAMGLATFLAISTQMLFGAAKAAMLVSVGTVAASFLLWFPPYYGWFLRTIGHGGGRHVAVLIEDRPFPMKGYLIVRTGTALLMFDGDHTLSEVPLETVRQLDQDTARWWCLPGCDCEYKGTETRQPEATFR